MSGAALPKLGPKAREIVDAVLRNGIYRAPKESDTAICRNLNSRQFLAQDKKDGAVWYPTAKLCELAGVTPPEIGQGGEGGPGAPDSRVQPDEGADRLPVPPIAEPGRALIRIPLDRIDVGFRLRQADPEKVLALQASFSELGHRTPISVTRRPDGERFLLSAGLHRLESARSLGWADILAFVEEGDDLDAELWEIDENLCRAELTPADRALFTFRRKEIHLIRHPETGHGGDRRSNGKVCHLNDTPKGFVAVTAEATGKSERAIRLDAERGEKISERALRQIRGTRHDTGVTLDRLKGLTEQQQLAYVEALREADKRVAEEAKTIRDGKQALSRKIRGAVIRAIAERGTVSAGAMPRAAFPIIYADPPWEQEAWSEERGQDRGLSYPHMPLAEIKALCAGDASPATRDALLFLWVTANRLDDGIDVLRAWGFDYVTCLVWDKSRIGMGRWVRDRHELLLLGKRGNFPAPIPGTQSASVHAEVRGEHSAKPVYFAEMIERLYPDLPKLELFQRRESLVAGDVRLNGNWTFWGNQAGVPQGEEESSENARVGRACVTKEELAEFKALGAVDGGCMGGGPLLEEMIALGLVWPSNPPQLTVGGAARLRELEDKIKRASDGDAVRCAKSEEA
ncbi:MT-A70 family methyltransferase [Sinorhizobium meliloti]|uniref:MT-A70 family methyltransferase n=1 Tax=Rhizobium meliloti TaxID=382 RepID=UPI0002DD8DC1|nr:MT-A70 family methyltransferase [Sinorhizobium meliloti]MDE4595930.1 ParB N-terminal domain-containing protein [Sinorhizobium meliloti]